MNTLIRNDLTGMGSPFVDMIMNLEHETEGTGAYSRTDAYTEAETEKYYLVKAEHTNLELRFSTFCLF